MRARLDNLELLRTAYGPDIGGAVLVALGERLEGLFDGLPTVIEAGEEAGTLGVYVTAPRERAPSLIDTALLALGSRPVIVAGTPVLAAVSVTADDAPQPAGGTPALPPAAQARADMAVAVATFEAVAEGRLYFLFQSITAAADGASLYQECFPRIVDRTTEDEMQTPRGFIPALERLGLTRRFDRAVVEGGVDFLTFHPEARVGCNISALSAVNDAWWAPVLERLAAAPELARRLVVEITETTPRADLEPILGFVRAFRRVGCRIAIDNFGAGFSGLRFAVAAAPDIIKIDACYVREQAADAFGSTYLGHLVGLARCLAGEVVVVGIDNDSDLARARAAAAEWVQGRHVAPAALFRGAVARLVEIFSDTSRKQRRVEVLSYRRGAAGESETLSANG